MKNHIITIVILAFILISASTYNNTPPIPKAVFAKRYMIPSEAIEDIQLLSKRGYIVKTCSIGSSNYGSTVILVMEKY